MGRAAGVIGARNPRTGLVDCHFAPASPAAVRREAARLRKAQPAWEALGPQGRATVLETFAQSLERHAAPITAALAVDTGRQAIARIEVDGLPGMVRRWSARAVALLDGAETAEVPSATPGVMLSARLSALPLVGVIAPWNFPVLLSHIDAFPALAAGCAVLIKPSEVTPRWLEPLRAALAEVPELAAVLGYVPGGAATGRAVAGAVDAICFTGSTATGRKVGVAAARRLIPAFLELGGKDPLIVLAGADPVRAAHVALRASVVATGQACQSIERVLVARAIAEPFLAELVRGAEAARLTFPDPGSGEIGPFIHAAQADKVAAQLADAVAKGARVLAGGTVETLGGGLWLRPTVVVDVTPAMALLREETFGPVLPVTLFDTPDEAVALANAGDYGLSAAVIGADSPAGLAEATALAARLEAGAVTINDAGLTTMVHDAANHARKGSGLGPSRMGDEGLLRFLRRQALIRQTGTPLPLAAYAEDNRR